MNWRRTIVGGSLAWALMGQTMSAQTSAPFLFSVSADPDPATPGRPQTHVTIAERGLAVWSAGSGRPIDLGVGTEVRTTSELIVRSTRGAAEFTSGGERFRSFDRLEVVRPMGRIGRVDMAVGGGVHQEFDGTQTFFGRAIGGLPFGGGRLEANAVFERARDPRRDSVDLITTIGWSRNVANGLWLGAEAIGQDVEGFWNRDEADGGARLLAGPSLHVAPTAHHWSLTIAAGPVLRSTSPVVSRDGSPATNGLSSRGRYAVLGTFTYSPPLPW